MDDVTNADPRFRRNRIRHEVLPLLADVAQRDVVPVLVRAARHQRQVVELLAALSDSLDPSNARALSEADPALAAVAIRRWWNEVTDSPYSPDERAIARILEVGRGDAVACDVHDGWRVARHRQILELIAPSLLGGDARQVP